VDVSPEQLERVYRARYGAFRNALAPIAGSYERAHDAVQDAFARALADPSGYRGGSLEAWLWRIALRRALDARRRDRRATPTDAEPVLVEPAHDPVLTEALRSLPPRRRQVVFLRFVAGLSYAEIAEVCAIGEGTVAATLTQARAALRAALEEVP
jgi:RNA polymerase sigma-70 factor (ECF subfamily)